MAKTQNKNARQSPRTHRAFSQNTKLSSTHRLGLIALRRQSRLRGRQSRNRHTVRRTRARPGNSWVTWGSQCWD